VLQAIGSEVAAETSRSMETKAPAQTVAVSRKETVISKPLCIVSSNPTFGSVPLSMHGACQTEIVVIFQYPMRLIAKNPPREAPTVGEKSQLLSWT
jgi:hypothetical protein